MTNRPYTPPEFRKSAFNCPFCHAYSNMEWDQLTYAHTKDIAPFFAAFCVHCKKFSYWHVFDQYVRDLETEMKLKRLQSAAVSPPRTRPAATRSDTPPLKKIEASRMVVPDQVTAPTAHPDMPHDVRAEYEEARRIASASPRSAAALLRLAIQRLCVHLGQPGKNLNKEIGALVEHGLPVEMQQALDVLRVVGNNAVHPGELSPDDVADVASSLFSLLNEIIEERISRPKKRRELFDALPEGARKAIEKRDRQ